MTAQDLEMKMHQVVSSLNENSEIIMTVPEALNGHYQFPASNSNEYYDFKSIENELLKEGLVEILSDEINSLEGFWIVKLTKKGHSLATQGSKFNGITRSDFNPFEEELDNIRDKWIREVSDIILWDLNLKSATNYFVNVIEILRSYSISETETRIQSILVALREQRLIRMDGGTYSNNISITQNGIVFCESKIQERVREIELITMNDISGETSDFPYMRDLNIESKDGYIEIRYFPDGVNHNYIFQILKIRDSFYRVNCYPDYTIRSRSDRQVILLAFKGWMDFLRYQTEATHQKVAQVSTRPFNEIQHYIIATNLESVQDYFLQDIWEPREVGIDVPSDLNDGDIIVLRFYYSVNEPSFTTICGVGVVDSITHGEKTIANVDWKYKGPAFDVPNLYFEDYVRTLNNLEFDEILRRMPSLDGDYIDERGSEHPDVLPTYTTEGNHSSTLDQLEFSNDINALASVISLKSTIPPLAIGLFAKWGSGKSFFMQKLEEQIEYYCSKFPETYMNSVVNVKFNSWHYSDSNLWASLITHIFESLSDYASNKTYGIETVRELHERLSISKAQIEITQNKLSEYRAAETQTRNRISDLNKIIELKKSELSNLTSGDVLRIVLTDPLIEERWVSLKEECSDVVVLNKLNDLTQLVDDYADGGSRLWKAFQLFRNNWRGKWKYVWFISGLVLFLTWMLFLNTDILKSFAQKAFALLAIGLPYLSIFLLRFSPQLELVKSMYRHAKNLKDRIETKQAEFKLRENDEILSLKSLLDNYQAEREALNIELQVKLENKNTLEKRLEDIKSGKLISNFLNEKSIDSTYQEQLGIISWIRKDFSTLNDMFIQKRAMNDGDSSRIERMDIDRIILYIDDLDRCNEEIVVKVLEAIHLLLAFPLFVVVVGVDPRWINNAISNRYRNLFEKIEGEIKDIKSNHPARQHQIATSYDYLEKIFQIPFTLKNINKASQASLVKYLIRDEMDLEQRLDRTNAINGSDNIPIHSKESKNTSPLEEGEIHNVVTVTNSSIKLSFTQDELNFMQNLSPIYGHTPRSINRYVNIYRIIKSHKSYGGNNSNKSLATLFVLSIIVGCPELALAFVNTISMTEDNMTLSDIFKILGWNEKYISFLTQCAGDRCMSLKMVFFKKNLELISRFSFRTLNTDVPV